MSTSIRSPYRYSAPITDRRLLATRRAEIDGALDALAREDSAESEHPLVLGPQRSGRTTVLLELARRVREERSMLPVWLRLREDDIFTQAGLVRHLLTAIVETIATESVGAPPEWYLAWRDRVYLRNAQPSSGRDRLASSLIYAADQQAAIDPVVLQRDLATLTSFAHGIGFRAVVVFVDDATELSEDLGLVELLIEFSDAVGLRLVLSGLPSTADHFIEGASPCIRRIFPVWLMPFRGTRSVLTCLSAPLDEIARKRLVDSQDTQFLRDLLRLTGGSPFEIMLVAHHLWVACELGEQDKFQLTPRVLDRVTPHLALYAAGGDALRDGASAIDKLMPEQMRQALDLVALSQLSVRQIAIARILNVATRDASRVDRRVLNADLETEVERVLHEVRELQEAGVVVLNADATRFVVQGGRPTSVLLKYKAQARLGDADSSRPFDLDFLLTVGRALARDAMSRTIEHFDGARSLGFAAVETLGGPAGKFALRPATRDLAETGDLTKLIEAEVDPVPWDGSTYKRIAELLTSDDPAVALVCTTLSAEQDQLEYLELWELPSGATQQELAERLAAVAEEWQPVVEAAELVWRGTANAVVSGKPARRVLFVLEPGIASLALQILFGQWMQSRDGALLERAIALGDEAVAALRQTGLPEWQLGGELSNLLSRVGFIKSFDTAKLSDARATLAEALESGPADGWVTHWNLANVAARSGDFQEARRHLSRAGEELPEGECYAHVLFYAPGYDPADSLISVVDPTATSVLRLQREIFLACDSEQRTHSLADALAVCERAEDEGARRAGEMAARAFSTSLPGVGTSSVRADAGRTPDAPGGHEPSG